MLKAACGGMDVVVVTEETKVAMPESAKMSQDSPETVSVVSWELNILYFTAWILYILSESDPLAMGSSW
jgi:hypothetical protein